MIKTLSVEIKARPETVRREFVARATKQYDEKIYI